VEHLCRSRPLRPPPVAPPGRQSPRPWLAGTALPHADSPPHRMSLWRYPRVVFAAIDSTCHMWIGRSKGLLL
jgi:hypothetical protein